MTRLIRVCLVFCLAACLAANCPSAKSASSPQGQAPGPGPGPAPAPEAVPAPRAGAGGDESLPRDSHNGVVISAKPCTDPAVAKEKFGKANPLPLGILPVEVFFHNETNQPIRIDLSTVQLSIHSPGGHSQDIEWLTIREVASAVAHPNGPPAPHQPRFPTIGVPTGADSKADKLVAILQPLALDADVLPPQSVIHGFLFFDLDRDLSLAQNASLYVPDVSTIPANKPLMFFEVPLNAPAKP
jgi:hypothetical protein